MVDPQAPVGALPADLSGHTPGPWSVGPLADEWTAQAPGSYMTTHVRSSVAGGDPVCLVVGRDKSYYGDGDAENEANACLIAAAPDLYEWLRRCEEMVSTDAGPPDWDGVRAALARATGASS